MEVTDFLTTDYTDVTDPESDYGHRRLRKLRGNGPPGLRILSLLRLFIRAIREIRG
jgi:hypothetical protein